MKNVLIINAHQKYPGKSNGELTSTLIDIAFEILTSKSYSVTHTNIESGYNVKEELEKFSNADTVIFQYPVYWMHIPYIAKEYIDKVFSGGKGTVTFTSDGRSSDDSSKQYGSGGLLKGKTYMLSMTYNCPKEEFDNPSGFWEGMSLDQANIAVHKIFQFCGMKPLKSHAVHDVHKAEVDIASQLQSFKEVLHHNF